MKKVEKIIRFTVFLVLSGIFIFGAGCAKNFSDMSAREIYQYGTGKLSDNKRTEAIEAFEALIDLYPFSVYVSKAELGIADGYYAKKRWDEAIPAYEDFLTRHPTSDHVPHVVYHLGMCYYKKKMAIDRDQYATFESEANFQNLVTNHQDSKYYDEAKAKLTEVRKDLAKRERYIAKFYYREKEYYASLRRYLRVIRNYPDTKYFEEALFYSGICYYQLKEFKNAKRQFKLLRTKYPSGRYAKKSQKIVAKMD